MVAKIILPPLIPRRLCIKKDYLIRKLHSSHLILYQTNIPVMKSVRSGRVYIFCSDVHVQNQEALFTKLLDKITKLEGVL